LSLYGIPMAQTILARSDKEAQKALSKIKGPVVMKIASPDILHKTDVGGVVMGVTTPEEASAAYDKILRNVKRVKPKAKITGVTVMETAKEGLELIIGAKRDPIFGPVVMFGSGGILVELISDFAVAVGPFDVVKIRKMIAGTKVSRIIGGYRKNQKYSEAKLVKIILAVGQLISDHPEIQSIEINPLILDDDGRGAIGLDAKIEMTVKD